MSALLDGGRYYLMNAAGQTVVDLHWGRTANGTPVHGYGPSMDPSDAYQACKIWRINYVTPKNPDDRHWFTITNEMSGTNLDMSDDVVHGWEAPASGAENTNQQWNFWPIQTGKYYNTFQIYNRTHYLKNPKQYRCLELTDGSTTGGTRIKGGQAKMPGDELKQSWMLIRLEKQGYYLKN